ncbi:MAG: PAS domain-containing sensor histidine kinase [Pseudomonadota bacterium]
MSMSDGYSYLDLSVHPVLERDILSVQPVVVFSETLNEIIWSNAAGAKLFGGNTVIDLLAMKLSADNSLVRQLNHAISDLPKSGRIVRGVRITRKLRTHVLQFEIQKFKSENGFVAYKVSDLSQQHQSSIEDSSLAESAIASLANFADASAVLDDEGTILASDSEYTLLSPEASVMEQILAELAEETDRLIKRPVQLSNGTNIALGLARITDNPGRNLVVIAKTRDDEIQTDEASAIVSHGIIEDLAEPETDQTEPELRPEILAPTATDPVSEADIEPELDENQSDAEPETRLDKEGGIDYGLFIHDTELNIKTSNEEDGPFENVTTNDDAAEAIEDGQEDLTQTGNITEDDTSAEISAVNSATLNEDEQGDHSQSEDSDKRTVEEVEEIDQPAAALDLIRFAWTIDQDGVFQSVSEELEQVVGNRFANLSGRNWRDISSEMQFDQGGDIARLLGGKDTWSGKTVLWPVAGSDMRVPVDMAALPMFDANRNFTGFRGFGKIFINEMIEQPLTEGTQDGNFTAFHQEDTAKDNQEFTDPQSDINQEVITGEPVDGFSSEASIENEDDENSNAFVNVVPFVRNTTEPKNLDSLSEKEQRAIESVRDHLRKVDPEFEATARESDDSKPVDTSLMEKLPVAVLIYNDQKTLFANRKLLETTGYNSLEELDRQGGVAALLDTSPEESKSGQFVKTATGDRFQVNPILHTVPWAGDRALLMSFEPPIMLGIQQPDVLELTELSEIHNILDTTTDGIILLDKDGSIISINASAEALFGQDFDDVVDNPLTSLFAPESQETIQTYFQSVSQPGIESLLNDGEEAIAREANGGMIPIFITISRMDSTGKLCAVVRDITSWKKAEEELIHSRKTAEEVSQQKSEFLAEISHEIRTPLNAIIGFSDVMIEERFGPVGNERYREYLRDIKRSGTHVLDLVNELLDLSKIEAGKLDLSFEAVNLNEMVAETVALLQPEANANRTIIRTSLSRAVPKVVADPRSIRQIILNLVSNAIKYSNANSQVIVSTVYETNGEVALRVRDTGQGMSQLEIEAAMQPFQQVHSIKERTKQGTGLGLPLTKALVEANRAYFDLESELGQGTIAHVQFPTQRVLAE